MKKPVTIPAPLPQTEELISLTVPPDIFKELVRKISRTGRLDSFTSDGQVFVSLNGFCLACLPEDNTPAKDMCGEYL